MPGRPSLSSWPYMSASRSSRATTFARSGRDRAARKLTLPGWSAVMRVTMTWSSSDENASRVYVTPPTR
jgi:hypothetical protein